MTSSAIQQNKTRYSNDGRLILDFLSKKIGIVENYFV